eukprot:1910357-Lingulodinium_polyedra.AAC.1
MDPVAGFRFPMLLAGFAETGEMHADLANELQEMNMVATCELRIEEVHARIKQLNASVGRNLDPASTCARLRWAEHRDILEDWRARAFVIHAWDRFLPRWLLQFPMGPNNEFVRHAPLT